MSETIAFRLENRSCVTGYGASSEWLKDGGRMNIRGVGPTLTVEVNKLKKLLNWTHATSIF